ncbi:MAG: isoaspartyl peptidase/L-asparaginase [Acidimicrobiales bacterium]
MTFHSDSGSLGLPAIVLHGGAGAFSAISNDEAAGALVDALRQATDAGWAVLSAGGRALDAVTEAVVSLEDSGRFNAGRGAVPTETGTVEFDASVMDSASGAVGALCAATYPANPIRAARAVAAAGGVPNGPVLLAGAGADKFCEQQGLVKMRPDWLHGRPGADDAPSPTAATAATPAALSDQGTVGAVAVDATGGVAAATSTGGRAGQVEGRVGDSPIPGAGVLATPSGVAVSATGAGEAFLVAGFAHRVAWSVEQGSDLHTALEEALVTVGRLGGFGGGIVISATGEFASAFSSPAMARSWRGNAARETLIRPS